MIRQYPHTITVTITAASTQDSDGNWVPGSISTLQKECRAEPNGGNGKVVTADGVVIDYAWEVYMPLPAVAIPVGAKVEVHDGATLILSDTVKRYHVGQLNCKLWL